MVDFRVINRVIRVSGIYAILSLATQKIYIGNSVHIYKRRERHFGDLKYGIHGNIYLQRHVKKYGLDDLDFCILEQLPPDKQLLDEREKFWISFYQSHVDKNGFNLNQGGLGGASTTRKHKSFSLVRIEDGLEMTFDSINHFEEFTGKFKHLSEVLNGQRKSIYGWTTKEQMLKIVEKRNRPPKQKKSRTPSPSNNKFFRLKNKKTGAIVEGIGITRFCQENGLCVNSVYRVLHEERKSHKDWVKP